MQLIVLWLTKMKRALFLIIILVITIKGAIAQGENLVKDGSFENVDRIKSDFGYAQGWDFGYYTITDRVVSKWGKTFLDPIGSTGRFLIVDVNASKKQRLWYDSITIKPNTVYSFTCLIANIYATVSDNNPYAAREYIPVLQLNVNGKKVSRVITLYSNRNDNWETEWKTLSGEFTSGPDQTRIEISIVDKEWGRQGNDVAIDNISFVEIENSPVVKDKKKRDEKEILPVVAVVTEPVKEIPPVVVKEEPVVVTPPPVIKEEPPVVIKEEEPVITPPSVIKEEPVVDPPKPKPVDPPKLKPADPPKPKPIDPPKPKPVVIAVVAPPKQRPVVVAVPPKPKPVDLPKPKPVDLPKPKPVDPPKPVVKEKPKPEKPKAFTKDITISDIQVDEKLELSHIYFEKGKYHLLPTSIPELKGLMDFMNKYKTVRIRLEGHTESGGDPVKNILLSENRVKEVKKYLVEKGIETGRIEWVGYGGNKPLNIDGDEETKKLNRRVEVVVIGK